MKADIPLLKMQAAQAVPSWPKRRRGPEGRWSRLWPVYVELRHKGFTIREAVDWLTARYGLTRSEAVALGERWVELGLVRHVLDEHGFRDGHLYYRLQDAG